MAQEILWISICAIAAATTTVTDAAAVADIGGFKILNKEFFRNKV